MLNVQGKYDRMFDYLIEHGWTYLGADEWCDPVTTLKYLVTKAYQIETQRMYVKQRRSKHIGRMV